MAQILKEESRFAIIESAKQEFLEKGYKGASMRSIAKKSHMTVGNLYRYFKNKEAINLSIVAPTFKEIDSVLKSLTSNNVSMETRVFNLKPNVNDLKNVLDQLSEELVEIYYRHKTEFNILMLHSKLNEEITTWFSQIIDSLISQSFLMQDIDSNKDMLSRAYAEAIFSGIKSIFKDADTEKNNLKTIVKIYMRSFVYMLDNDLKRMGV